ncbi:AAA family ATPase [Pseudonocardia sp. DLS-67]
MGAGGMLPRRDPQAEVLHESERTRVSRLFSTGRTVIRKEPLGPDAERRLRHERAMLERLRDVAGVAQLEEPRYPGSIVLADVGGTSLAGLAKPLTVDVLIGLAVGLAQAVAGMHRRGVMHRDITPANIVISGDGVPSLVDFALATSFAEIRPEFAHHTQIVGTLAYLAPEQTGRTGRSVDQRADLYALGATLYELATGEPPFGTGDPLRLAHDHLARVPVPPAKVNSAVPESLSEVILHLLEKEPDHRYQTADGVVHDLERVREAQQRPAAASVRVGERDVPLRLLPPRLVSRDDEVATLQAAFEDAQVGRCRAVLVGGKPGVGKTALVDELRPLVAGRGGWFVAGKFDQYRRDLEFNGVHQAYRALGRLLLAEPEAELTEVRARILAALGPNAGLLTAVVPEFAALLAVPPDPGDPLTAQNRAQRMGVQALRAVASRERPVVLFLDDLQWAGRAALGLVDMMLDEEPVEGLLLVGAYRDEDVDAAHPPSRWRDHAGARHLRLDDLPVPSLVTMVAEMLHTDPAAAAGLAEVIEPHTSGNPYETVELLGALRRDGVLTATGTEWRWDTAAVRAHLGRSEVGELLAARIGTVPLPSRELVEVMAGLGGRAELSLLQIATGGPAAEVQSMLAPALAEGLLVVEPGAREAVRFRHDRIREAILRGLDPGRRRTLRLATARRLAEVPELYAVAAEQYLPVVDAIDDAGERRRVVGLLRRAADQATLIGDHALVNALLAAALRLIDPGDTPTLIAVHTDRHVALYGLGRLDEADEEYRTIEGLGPSALDCAAATAVQVSSLTHRNLFADAIGLGIDLLRELGPTVPAADRLTTELDHQFDHLHRWLDRTDAADDLARPELTEPTLLATTRLIDAVQPAAYFAGGHATVAWLSLESLRIWVEHGPGPTLIGPASAAAVAAVALRAHRAAGYRTVRRVVELGEARGYEPGTSEARRRLALLSCWFEPIENGVRAAERAREGLTAGGDLANAGYTYHPTAHYLLDCAPSLDVLVAEVEAGLAFVRRTGNEQTGQWLDSYQWLAGVLRGDNVATTGKAVSTDRYANNPMPLFHAHLSHALVAAVFGDPGGLARHAAAAMPLLPAVPGLYPTAVARLLRGLALAEEARTGHADERDGPLSELDEVTSWLAARAADAPDNFRHLQRLLEAERAWAVGDFRAGALAFDTAGREAAGRQRPWHRALITERAARFYLAHGVEQAGRDLLTRARQYYAAWGASAKVAQLDWAYPTSQLGALTAGEPGGDSRADDLRLSSTVTTGTLDLLGVLAASQALSSETDIERLHTRVVEVLSAMTGATSVHLLLWDDDRQDWLLPAPDHTTDPATAGSPHERDLPMSAVRYVQRTAEILVVDDATRDDRFARDPYIAGLGACSLLAMPILGRGALRAVLLLENRLMRAAVTTERLDAVRLIAAQLAVSLDNAQLYTDLTASRARIVAAADQARRRIERDLHDGAQQRLVTLGMRARIARAAVPPESGALREQLEALAAEAATAMTELRELARGIHPPTLAQGGLLPALGALGRRSRVPVRIKASAGRRLPEPVEVAAYYVVAEALTNATKHAEPSIVTVEVEIDTTPAGVVLRVRVHDDGHGGAHFTGGTGLLGLRDRVETLGGRLTLHSAPGAGTAVLAEFPLQRGGVGPS